MATNSSQPQHNVVQSLAQANEQTWFKLGNLAEFMSDYERAIKCYQQALQYNPRSVTTLASIASLCRGREQFAEAVDYFKRILEIQSNDGEMWAALGHCYLMMDKLQETYDAYQKALFNLNNPRDPKLWYGIGILYDHYGSLEHAEEAFSAVMKMSPNFEKSNEIYFRLGIIYKQQEKFDLSLQCFQYILHSPPRPLSETDIWFQTGHVYEQRKDYTHAKEAYERVLSQTPDHSRVLQQLGWLYHQQEAPFCDQAKAIEYLTRSIKSDGNDAQSWYLLGRCYMVEQNYNKAYEAYQQAVYRDSRNPTFWCSIGVLYYQINQYRDALDAYSRAIRLNPYISEVWYDLGTLYESCNNQINDALDAYTRALELDPENHVIKQRLELLRNSQNIQSSQPIGNVPVPQDVSNPSQYQYGHGAQPLKDTPYGESLPHGPPANMAAYHTPMGAPKRAGDERGSGPQLLMQPSSHHDGPGMDRDLPHVSGRRSPGPYAHYPPQSYPRENVRIADIGGGRVATPPERAQMNPILHEDNRGSQQGSPAMRYHPHSSPHMPSSLPPVSTSQRPPYAKQESPRSPAFAHNEPGHAFPPKQSNHSPSSSREPISPHHETPEKHRQAPLHPPPLQAKYSRAPEHSSDPHAHHIRPMLVKHEAANGEEPSHHSQVADMEGVESTPTTEHAPAASSDDRSPRHVETAHGSHPSVAQPMTTDEKHHDEPARSSSTSANMDMDEPEPTEAHDEAISPPHDEQEDSEERFMDNKSPAEPEADEPEEGEMVEEEEEEDLHEEKGGDEKADKASSTEPDDSRSPVVSAQEEPKEERAATPPADTEEAASTPPAADPATAASAAAESASPEEGETKEKTPVASPGSPSPSPAQ